MPTAAQVKSQIDALPHRYIFWTQKEIRALPEILNEGERIIALTSGLMNNSTWLAVGTTARVLFLNSGMILGLRQVQIPLDRVQSIDSTTGIAFGSICVWDGASYFNLSLALKSSVGPFVKAVQEAITRYRTPVSTAAAPLPVIESGNQPPAADVVSQLERLAALKEKGIITDAEFEAQKQRILST